jgi:hypothetical protein
MATSRSTNKDFLTVKNYVRKYIASEHHAKNWVSLPKSIQARLHGFLNSISLPSTEALKRPFPNMEEALAAHILDAANDHLNSLRDDIIDKLKKLNLESYTMAEGIAVKELQRSWGRRFPTAEVERSRSRLRAMLDLPASGDLASTLTEDRRPTVTLQPLAALNPKPRAPSPKSRAPSPKTRAPCPKPSTGEKGTPAPGRQGSNSPGRLVPSGGAPVNNNIPTVSRRKSTEEPPNKQQRQSYNTQTEARKVNPTGKTLPIYATQRIPDPRVAARVVEACNRSNKMIADFGRESGGNRIALSFALKPIFERHFGPSAVGGEIEESQILHAVRKLYT